MSAISKFNPDEYGGCPKKWWFRYIERLPETYTAAQQDGTKAHKQIEHYLETGENVLGPIALAGAHLLPAPGADLLVEWGMNNKKRPTPGPDGREVNFFPPEESILRADGLPLIGFMDWLNPRGTFIDPDGKLWSDPPNTAEIGDNKTGSNIAKYSKAGDTLIDTTQMAGYGEFLSQRAPTLEHVRLSHVNFQTGDKRAASKATALVSVVAVKAAWKKKGHDVVARMREVAVLRAEADVPGNLASCEAYNRKCDFAGQCSTYKNQNPITRLKNMGLFQKKTAAGNPAVNGAVVNQTPWIDPAVPAVPQPPAQAAKGFPPITDHVTASSAQQGHKYIVNGVETLFMMVMGTKAVFAPTAGGDPILLDPNTSVQVATAAVPVAAAPAPAPVVAAPPPPPVAAAPVQAASPVPPPPPAPPVVTTVRDAGAPPPPVPLAAEAAATPAAAATEAPKRGRGRPRKDSVPGQTIAAAQAATGFRLFINAVPSEAFTDLIGYVYEATGQLEEQFGVSDIRCVGDDVAALAFGKYKGALASMVKAEPPPPGTYVAFTEGNEFTAIVAEALASTCAPGQLVRGVR